MAKKAVRETVEVAELLRVPPGPVALDSVDPRSVPGFRGTKADARAALPGLAAQLGELQRRLYAEGRGGGVRRIVVVLHGASTAADDGIVKLLVAEADPAGVFVSDLHRSGDDAADDVLAHLPDRLPQPGGFGILAPSHYDVVFAALTRGLLPADAAEASFVRMRELEHELVQTGTRIVKVFLHLSRSEQLARLRARLDDPAQHWRYDPRDGDELDGWDERQQIHADVVERTNSVAAPWYVLPADRKWYRNWALLELVVEQLRSMDPQWPQSDVALELERKRLLALSGAAGTAKR